MGKKCPLGRKVVTDPAQLIFQFRHPKSMVTVGDVVV
jgi:hypothetical protein